MHASEKIHDRRYMFNDNKYGSAEKTLVLIDMPNENTHWWETLIVMQMPINYTYWSENPFANAYAKF